jgi:TIR domain
MQPRDPGCGVGPVNAEGVMTGSTSGKIFISYRRDDSPHVAGRLHDRLEKANFEVFMDVESMDPGVDFPEAIDGAVSRCDVLLALIGPHWMMAVQEHLATAEDSEDWVALEVRRALAREIRVIPVLVDGATMPQAHDLPPDLQALARRHAVRIDHVTFKTQADELVADLQRILSAGAAEAESEERLPGDAEPTPAEGLTEVRPDREPPAPTPPTPGAPETPPGPEPESRRRTVALAAIGLLVLVLVGALILLWPDSGSDSGGATTTTTAAPEVRDRLAAGDRLEPGEFIATADGRHRLEMTTTGLLVASTDGDTWWSSTPSGPSGSWATLQEDGNLVVYRSAAGGPVWASQTNRNPGAYLVIEDRNGTGRITISAGDGSVLWREPKHSEPERTTPETSTATTDAATTVPDTTAAPETTIP